jgi:hypothetical protein
MKNDQKALFDACMKQAEYFAGRWDRRRTDELRVTVAVWTLEVGGIYFVKKPELVPWWLIAGFVAVYGWFWLRPLWNANEAEMRRMIFYQEEADAIMRNPSHVLRVTPSYARRRFLSPAFLRSWSMQFQLIGTALLALLFYKIPRPT